MVRVCFDSSIIICNMSGYLVAISIAGVVTMVRLISGFKSGITVSSVGATSLSRALFWLKGTCFFVSISCSRGTFSRGSYSTVTV